MNVLLRYEGKAIGSYLTDGDYTIGRESTVALAIRGPGFGNGRVIITQSDGEVSREHLMICVSQGSLTLRDMDSRNGSYLDGARFSKKVIKESGTHQVTIGKTSLDLVITE
jgi:pSer/pThr/pTyr-binding forkhead associated (FHA) protein